MKKILFAITFAAQFLVGTQVLAAPCVSATLTEYITLGSAGCTIGNFTFSNFGLLEQPTGSVPFTVVNVTPVAVGTTAVGLDFGVNASATSGIWLENLISYRVAGIGASLNGASLFFTGSSTDAGGNGAATVVENLCIGGLFLGADGVSGCSTPQNLIVANSFNSADPEVSLTILPVALLAVVTDIAIDGGLGGFASLGSASNRFQIAAINAVPEPAAFLLVIAGLLALYGSRATRFFRFSRRA